MAGFEMSCINPASQTKIEKLPNYFNGDYTVAILESLTTGTHHQVEVNSQPDFGILKDKESRD